MARKLTRREITLALALVAVAIGVSYYSGDDTPTGARGAAAPGRGAAPVLGAAPVIALARLERPVADYNPQGRNLFQYYTPPVPTPRPLPTPVPTPFPTPPPAPPPPVVERGPIEPPRPKPPPISFTYVGYLGHKDSRIAVLEVASDMILARVGDVVAQQFKVVGFGYETLVIGYVDERFRGQTAELKQTQGSRKR